MKTPFDRRKARRWHALAVALAGVFALGLAGCTDARVVDSWRAAGDAGAPRSWLVVSRAGDAVQRRQAEDAVVTRMRRDGADARASYTLFPGGVPGTAALGRSLDRERLDAALVLDRVTTTTESRWVPGYRVSTPREYYNPWRGRDVVVWRDRWVPGYRQRDRVAHVQVTVWKGGDDAQLVYGATVEVLNPASSGDLSRDLAQALVPGLRREGLL